MIATNIITQKRRQKIHVYYNERFLSFIFENLRMSMGGKGAHFCPSLQPNFGQK